MNQIPEKVGLQDLKTYLKTAQTENAALDPEEMKEFIIEITALAEELVERLSATHFNSADTQRMTYYNRARKALKTVIRNLKGVIRV